MKIILRSLNFIHFRYVVQATQIKFHVAHEGWHFQFIVIGYLSFLTQLEAVFDVDLAAVQLIEVQPVPILQHVDRPHEVDLVLVHS